MRIRSSAWSMLAACVWLAAGCGGTGPRAWGEALDPAAAVPLGDVLARGEVARGEIVTVSGRIGEVCRSAGCWLVLQDTGGGKLHEVLVDLKPEAGFTVPPDVQGRSAVVRGRLVETDSSLALHAVGLRVE